MTSPAWMVEASVIDSIKSNDFPQFGYDSLLYLLQFAIHAPLIMLSVRFPDNEPGIGLVFIEKSEVAIRMMRSCYGTPDTCELCLANLTTAGKHILFGGDWGTYEWGEKHKDDDIKGDVAWSGENEFCDHCWMYKTYVYAYLSEHSPLRQRLLEKFPCNETFCNYLTQLDEA